jgi:hypothetical protein
MDDVLGQLPALVGVVIGTLGTILATSFADRSRWTRGMAVRWDERRLAAYIEYASALKDIAAVLMRMTAKSRPGALSRPMDQESGVAALTDLEARRTKAWEQVLLLGDPPTVEAARIWRTKVRTLAQLALRDAYTSSECQAAVEQVDDARDAFYEAARSGLAVPGGSITRTAWAEVPASPPSAGSNNRA